MLYIDCSDSRAHFTEQAISYESFSVVHSLVSFLNLPTILSQAVSLWYQFYALSSVWSDSPSTMWQNDGTTSPCYTHSFVSSPGELEVMRINSNRKIYRMELQSHWLWDWDYFIPIGSGFSCNSVRFPDMTMPRMVYYIYKVFSVNQMQEISNTSSVQCVITCLLWIDLNIRILLKSLSLLYSNIKCLLVFVFY